MIKRSEMMDSLYGQDIAKKVFDRLQYLDHTLNEEIQKIAYDHYWALPGLSIRDKSLVTITSLMVIDREEQIRIHLNGFLNSGGTVDETMALLLYLSRKFEEQSARKGFIALNDVLKERGMENRPLFDLSNRFNKEVLNKNPRTLLTENDSHIVEISSAVASGDLNKIDTSISNYLDSHSDGNYEDIRHMMIHQIAYCGFPATMNGFARLRKVLEERHAQELLRPRL